MGTDGAKDWSTMVNEELLYVSYSNCWKLPAVAAARDVYLSAKCPTMTGPITGDWYWACGGWYVDHKYGSWNDFKRDHSIATTTVAPTTSTPGTVTTAPATTVPTVIDLTG